MVAPTPFNLSKKQQEGIMKYYTACRDIFNQDSMGLRTHLEQVDKEYSRTNNKNSENVKAVEANKLGDKKRIQDVTIPIVQSQVESGVSYLSSVFLTGIPMISCVSNPQLIDVASQIDSIILENSLRGQWLRHFIMFFRDGLKYNIHAMECNWRRVKTYNPARAITTKDPKAVEQIWQGNAIKRLDMYNTFFDPRVMPAEIHTRGEFGGYVELMSRIDLKNFIASLPSEYTMNAKEAFESGYNEQYPYVIPEINPNALMRADPKRTFDWTSWVLNLDSQKIRYQNMYEVATWYARILPSDFDMMVPAKNTPQIWKFISVNGSVLIYAERQTNVHEWLPLLFGQPIEDGLWYQTLSFADNVIPFQDLTSSLWNSSLAAKRRSVYDRIFYDPLRIRESDINNSNPIARIPVRNSSYNKGVADAVHITPYDDRQSAGMVQEAQMLYEYANSLNGMNRPMQGLFQKGNKTVQEFDTTMGNANARMQFMALFVEAQIMTPLKEMIKLNILQYQPPAQIFNPSLQQMVEIDPAMLQQNAFAFQMSDGLTPNDKLISGDVLSTAMQVVGASPALMMEFDLVGMFTYWCKEKGSKWIDSFKRSQEQQQQFVSNQRQITDAQTEKQTEVQPSADNRPAQ